jgi:hypothetical protein
VKHGSNAAFLNGVLPYQIQIERQVARLRTDDCDLSRSQPRQERENLGHQRQGFIKLGAAGHQHHHRDLKFVKGSPPLILRTFRIRSKLSSSFAVLLCSERIWRRIQRRSGRTILFLGVTKLGCRNEALACASAAVRLVH